VIKVKSNWCGDAVESSEVPRTSLQDAWRVSEKIIAPLIDVFLGTSGMGRSRVQTVRTKNGPVVVRRVRVVCADPDDYLVQIRVTFPANITARLADAMTVYGMLCASAPLGRVDADDLRTWCMDWPRGVTLAGACREVTAAHEELRRVAA